MFKTPFGPSVGALIHYALVSSNESSKEYEGVMN